MKLFLKQPLFIICILLLSFFIVVISHSQEVQEADKCLQCHDKKYGLTEQFQHPLIKAQKCKGCHSSYDEGSHQESIKPEYLTCKECHDKDKIGRSHPVGPGVIDPNTYEIMTCVSTCHNPHGSDFKYELPFKNNMNLCQSCHNF